MAMTRPTRRSMHSEALPLIVWSLREGCDNGLAELLIVVEVGRAPSRRCGCDAVDSLMRQPQGNCRSYAEIAAEGQIATMQLD